MDVNEISDEMGRARAEFHELVATASPDDMYRPTDGTRWTNRELLFHMVLAMALSAPCLRWCEDSVASVTVAVSPRP